MLHADKMSEIYAIINVISIRENMTAK